MRCPVNARWICTATTSYRARVLTSIERAGARGIAIEADLTDVHTSRRLLDEVEQHLGPVSMLINNASGRRKDTFVPEPRDRCSRRTDIVSATTFAAQFDVDGDHRKRRLPPVTGNVIRLR
jgi:NAD(P)-dependent dehydrogenase (short-subunit alcohol dehydrogenase family)